jgi:hypothetical protein
MSGYRLEWKEVSYHAKKDAWVKSRQKREFDTYAQALSYFNKNVLPKKNKGIRIEEANITKIGVMKKDLLSKFKV